MASRQPLLAVADLDQALKLKPDFAPALAARGRVRLAMNDTARGKADLQAALAADPSLRLTAADAYVNAGLFADAIALYDAWIAAAPHDEDLAGPLAGRCWARALEGQDLDKALRDCDEALGLRSSTLPALAARSLIHLRRGELDAAIADDNAALRLAPKGPWALYVRGLAEQRKGVKDKADADLAAAVAIRPRLPAEAKLYGVTGS
jgi:tetratricopeptide (TPR) repeat protein